jgi:lipid-binding SYLF domain-containing protein
VRFASVTGKVAHSLNVCAVMPNQSARPNGARIVVGSRIAVANRTAASITVIKTLRRLRGLLHPCLPELTQAPGAITLDSGSLGVQLGGEEINIVILSMDKSLRSKLLSDRFAIGSDASAAWGNGASAHGDPNAKIRFYGHTKGAFAGFDLDGATLKPDDSGNKALYGKTLSNGEIVAGVTAPSSTQTFVATIAHASSR